MWFWQPKNTLDRFWLVCLIISCIWHSILFMLFFFYKGASSQLSFVITPGIPLRTTPITYSIASFPAPTKSQPKSSKNMQKQAQGTTIAAKPEDKKSKAKPVKKAEPKKEVKQTKPTVKPPEKKEEKKVEPIKPVPLPVKPVEGPVQQMPDVINLSTQEGHMGLQEQAFLEEFYALREQVVSHWAPPGGLSDSCMCEIMMHIDWQGQLKECVIQKSSGVLIYDSVAQAALYEIELPKWTWGKTITIAFKQ